MEEASETESATTNVPMTEEQMRAAQVGELAPLVGRIQIVDYDSEWPRLFEREVERIQVTLGDRVLLIEHVGSTSVPELAAKPRIDILLVVADSADEEAYVPALEAAAYILRIREPDWYEHRRAPQSTAEHRRAPQSTACSKDQTRISISTSSHQVVLRLTECYTSVTGCAAMKPIVDSTSVPSGS